MPQLSSTERLQQRLKAQAGGEDVGNSAWRGAPTCGFLATYSSERFSPAITLTTSFLRRAAAGETRARAAALRFRRNNNCHC